MPATSPSDAPVEGAKRLAEAAEDGRLAALASTHGLALIVVFGSVAEGVDAPADLDLAIEPIHALDRASLFDDLASLAGTSRIDLLDLSRAGTVARCEALAYGYPIHESGDGRFADAQMAAVTAWADSRWLRQLDLDVLAGR